MCRREAVAANGANCIFLPMAVTSPARCMFVPSIWRGWTPRPITRRSFCPEIVTDGATPQRYCAFTLKELVSNKDKSFAYIRCFYLLLSIALARDIAIAMRDTVWKRKFGLHVIVYRVLSYSCRFQRKFRDGRWSRAEQDSR